MFVCMMMKMSTMCLSQWFHAVIEAGDVGISPDVLGYIPGLAGNHGDVDRAVSRQHLTQSPHDVYHLLDCGTACRDVLHTPGGDEL